MNHLRGAQRPVPRNPPDPRSMPRNLDLANLKPRRICIVKPSAFGDIVQSLPLIAALRRRYPAASISWVIRDDLQDLVAGHPDLAESIVFRRTGGVREFLKLMRLLRSRRFDMAIDLQGLARSGLMTLATRAPVRIGLETAREGAWLGYTTVIRHTGRHVPAAARYWKVAEAMRDGAGPNRATIFVPRHDQQWARALLDPLPRPVIAVHAGAIWESKRCPPEVFATILKRVHDRFNGSTILLGTEADASAAAKLQSLLRPRTAGTPPTWWRNRRHLQFAETHEIGETVDLTGGTSIKQLAALLQEVDVLLCNDSGPMHLAAALDTPVAGLFTCTSPKLSGPQSRRHHLFSADVPCAAGYHKSCPHRGDSRLRCHQALPIERISRALEDILTTSAATHRATRFTSPTIVSGYEAMPA